MSSDILKITKDEKLKGRKIHAKSCIYVTGQKK